MIFFIIPRAILIYGNRKHIVYFITIFIAKKVSKSYALKRSREICLAQDTHKS